MSAALGPYALGRVHHADCLEAMRLLPDGCVDAVVTDPPYSRAGAASTGRRSLAGRSSAVRESDQFWLYWFRSVCAEMTRATKPTGHALVFCDYKTSPLIEEAYGVNGWAVTQCLVWDRESIGMGSPFRASHELVAFARGPGFKWRGRKDLGNVIRSKWPYCIHKNHPAEKPVDLLLRLVGVTTAPGAIVLDPFAGSGSVGVACSHRSLGEAIRGYIGFEIEERLVDLSNRRIEAEHERLGDVPATTAKPGQQAGLFAEEDEGEGTKR